MKQPSILIAAGGTGGHIYPAIAVADALRELVEDLKVTFVGTDYGLEKRLVPFHGYDLETIDVRYLKGTKAFTKAKHLGLLPRAAWQSARVIWRNKPQLVIGAGGYTSGPVVGIASMMGKPTAIMEQNAIPGLTNRLLGRFVRQIFVSFEAERYAFADHKVKALGNPVRAMNVDQPDVPRQDGKLHLLVFGGSQGAKSLNDNLPRVLGALGAEGAELVVRHQSGRGRNEPVEAAYQSSGFQGSYEVKEFIHDMPGAYAWADFVVCRAGATTVAELKAAGKPAVLVPFPYAAHNHQEENARAMVDQDAARMVLDAEMAGDTLVKILKDWVAAPESVEALGKRAREIAQPYAARDVALACMDLMGIGGAEQRVSRLSGCATSPGI